MNNTVQIGNLILSVADSGEPKPMVVMRSVDALGSVQEKGQKAIDDFKALGSEVMQQISRIVCSDVPAAQQLEQLETVSIQWFRHTLGGLQPVIPSELKAVKSVTIGNVSICLLDDDRVVYQAGAPGGALATDQLLEDFLALPLAVGSKLLALSRDSRPGAEKFADIEALALDPALKAQCS